MIRLTCETCSASLEVRGGEVRPQAKCPCCGSPFRPPKEGSPVIFPAFTEGRWYRCPQCAAETFFDPKLSPLACSYCGSGKLLQVPDLTGSFEEHYFLPFLINPDQARVRVQSYLGSHLWAPAEVREQLRSAPPMPHFVPTYQISCNVRTSLAEAGTLDGADEIPTHPPLSPEDDAGEADSAVAAEGAEPDPRGAEPPDGPATAVADTRESHDAATLSGLLPAPEPLPSPPAANAGPPGSRMTSVVRRWRKFLRTVLPAPGPGGGAEESHAGYYNERVPCTQGVPPEQFRRLLPYNYRMLRPFRPLMLGSAKLERPAESEDPCWERVTEKVIATELAWFQKHHRLDIDDEDGPEVRVVFLDRKVRLVMMPVYVIGYHYQGHYHRLLINGQTGKLVEVVHLSATRLALGGIALGGAVLALVLALLSTDIGTLEQERLARARQMEALGTIPLHLQVTPNATFGSLFSERNLGSLEPAKVLQKTWNAGEDPLGDLLRAGETQHAAGQLERAREAYERMLKEYPEDPRSVYHWARFRLSLGEAEEVEPRVEALLQRNPAFTRGYEVLARCKAQRGKYAEAVEWFEKAHERSAPDPFTTYDAADLCRVFLRDPERAIRLYKRFIETPESGPANTMIRFLIHHLEGKADPYLIDTVHLKSGGSLRGKIVARDARIVRLKLLTGRGSAELQYDSAEVERIDREPEPIKVEFDRLLNEYDRLLLERRGVLRPDDLLALARLCHSMTDLRVKETAIFFALRLRILDPTHEEAGAILDAGGYSVSRNRLVRKPVLDRRRARDERY